MIGKRWSAEDVIYLQKHWGQSIETLSRDLERSTQSICNKARQLGLYKKRWTQEQIDYLQENYGKISIPALAKQLGKTVNAVRVMRERLGLGAFLMNGEYISLNQLLLAVCGGTFYERAANRVCAPCRAARKRQGFRKYQYLSSRR